MKADLRKSTIPLCVLVPFFLQNARHLLWTQYPAKKHGGGALVSLHHMSGFWSQLNDSLAIFRKIFNSVKKINGWYTQGLIVMSQIIHNRLIFNQTNIGQNKYIMRQIYRVGGILSLSLPVRCSRSFITSYKCWTADVSCPCHLPENEFADFHSIHGAASESIPIRRLPLLDKPARFYLFIGVKSCQLYNQSSDVFRTSLLDPIIPAVPEWNKGTQTGMSDTWLNSS